LNGLIGDNQEYSLFLSPEVLTLSYLFYEDCMISANSAKRGWPFGILEDAIIILLSKPFYPASCNGAKNGNS
jgi:hypothetical protein